MVDFDIKPQAVRLAELRSECTRIRALLGVFASLLALVLIRGVITLIHGQHGQAWPFAVLLAAVTAYELIWLRVVRQAISAGRGLAGAAWIANTTVESLLPTTALFLQVHSPFFGPGWALTSPEVLLYLLFIILSTLHLDPALSRLAGMLSAAEYAAVSLYIFLLFPEVAAHGRLLAYSTSFSCVVFLLIGGFAAGAVASQIRLHVLAALDEAERRTKIEHDLGIARSIQQGLFPKTPPQINGFDIAGWNRPADETGGDYFDWQQVRDGRVAVTIADVTGHGIGPAIGMTGCRAYARAGLHTESDLRSMLNRLNQLLYQDLPAEKFVTLATGLLNPPEASLELISAGHGPLIFYSSAADRFVTLEAQGPPLGLLPEFGYCSPRTLKFAPGDILLLITDGFVEWANADDEDFGQKRLEEVIRASRQLPATKIIAELYAAVVRFVGSMPQPDDLTALVVKRS